MTLRLRLVLALVCLTTLGQVAYFAGTSTAYRSSEVARLDAQLRSSEPAIDAQLDAYAGSGSGQGARTGSPGEGGSGGPPPGGGSAPTIVVPPGTFAELRSDSGRILSHIQESRRQAQPELPARLPPPTPGGRTFTVRATTGGVTFRVLEVPARNDETTFVAIPTAEVSNALRRLVLIEAAATAAVLVFVSAGAWLVLRRGLRPLERMARTAARISAGDLSQRVEPAGGPGEVGQLGQALNTMLADIEGAFREMEQSEARLRQFLADASHELRTPLTSIQGFAELFRVAGDRARVDLPTILRRIEQESARMKALVEDLLLLARIDEARPVERRPVDLRALAADACADAVAADRTRAVTLDAAEGSWVLADEHHLRQAIANLVTNAVRHTPVGSPIEVSVGRHSGEVVIAVRDHGPGLGEDALRHVFDRFWQGDKARVGSGAGLGLSIVSAIAAEHRGTATAANAAGGGACFSIRLPGGDAPGADPGGTGEVGGRSYCLQRA